MLAKSFVWAWRARKALTLEQALVLDAPAPPRLHHQASLAPFYANNMLRDFGVDS
jgi:hypothetical protein